MNKWFKRLFNNRGEIDLGDKTEFTADEVKDIVNKQVDSLIQPKIDSIVKDRLERERGKYSDYEDLQKFKIEHEKNAESDKQKNLEAQGKYDEAMQIHNQKVADLTNVLNSKDTQISNMQIGNALTNEIIAQGGYLEETLAMLRSSAELKDGVVTIKGKSADGIDQSYSVADGVKSFLEKKPHLVKAAGGEGGAGTGGAGGAGAGGGQAGNEGGDLTTLNNLLATQSLNNDFKGAADTRAKIKAIMVKDGKTISGGIIA